MATPTTFTTSQSSTTGSFCLNNKHKQQYYYPRPFVFGEVLYDHFPNESKLGGAPFNVAWNLSALSMNPIFISRIGNDSDGLGVLESAKSWGLDCCNIQIDKNGHKTGYVKVTLDPITNDASYQIVEGVAYDYIDYQSIQLPSDLIKLCKDSSAQKVNAVNNNNSDKIGVFIYHGTLCLRQNQSKNALYQFINNLENNYGNFIDIIRFVDVNLRAPYWTKDETIKILKESNVKYAKLNEEELPLLCDTNYKDMHDITTIITDCIKFANDFDLYGLILTLGKNGSLVVDTQHKELLRIRVGGETRLRTFDQFYNDPEWFVNSPQGPERDIKIVDTVGAGDSYASVIIAGLIQNWPLAITMNRADNLACRVVTICGAQLETKDVYNDILSKEIWGLDALQTLEMKTESIEDVVGCLNKFSIDSIIIEDNNQGVESLTNLTSLPSLGGSSTAGDSHRTISSVMSSMSTISSVSPMNFIDSTKLWKR